MAKSRGNGEGSIYYSEPKELWVAQYSYGRLPNGKRKRKTFYARTRKEVKGKLEAFTTSVNAGTVTSQSAITVETLASDIIENEHNLNVLSDNSYNRKKGTLDIIKQNVLAKKAIQKLCEDDITAFLSTITNYANSTIKKIYGLLNQTLNVAVERNIILSNPLNRSTVVKPKSNKATKKITAFTIDEQKKLIAVLTKKNQTLCNDYNTQMLLSLFTGMRMGEINALSTDDVDLENKVIHIHRTVTRDAQDKAVLGKVTKTYAGQRDLTMSPTVVKILQDHFALERAKTPEKLLFYNFRNCSVISTSQVNCEFKRMCEKIGVVRNVNQHMLRHTFATRCIESEMPAKILQKILGHTDIKTTLNTYCDVFESFESEHIGKAEKYLKDSGLSLS